MCGIAGIAHLTGPAPIDPGVLREMIAAMRYRGPDESGVYVDDHVGLAQTRLSIIDLAGGVQPIGNEDGTLWIVYNGEVFNYPELRAGLERRGHRFSTTTDTEVILHLYEEEGSACLEQLNGQWALAIRDTVNNTLFLARDRVGIRPLHYTIAGGRLIFASEIKALFVDNQVTRELDPRALEQTFTFWTTLPGTTAFKDIKELPPGHCMTVREGAVSVEKYWDVPLYPRARWIDDPPEVIAEKLMELLLDAVRIRLRADVPVGAYLSGGLDSSAVTSLIVKHFNNDVRSFGIRFEESTFDEGSFQDQMVEYLGVNHSEIRTRNSDIARLFPGIIRHTERPLLRTAPVPLHMLSRLVRDSNYKVVLTGEGADEIFGGYNIFRETLARRFLGRNPDSSWRVQPLQSLYPHIFRNAAQRRTLRGFFDRGAGDIDDPFYSHSIRWNNTARIKLFFSDDFRAGIGSYSAQDKLRESLPAEFHALDTLGKAQFLETTIFLSNYLLSSQGDRMAMANSVEIRLPYLDYRVMEYAGRISSTWKILGMNEKHILKKTFAKVLPDSVAKRPKHPYRAPIQQGLYGERPDTRIEELLSRPAVENAGVFDANKTEKLKQRIRKRGVLSEVDGMALAGIVSTQALHEAFLGDRRSEPARDVSPERVVDRRSRR